MDGEIKKPNKWLKKDEFDRIKPLWLSQILKEYCLMLLEHFKDNLISIVIYGSVSRNLFVINKSDVDVLLIVKKWDKSPLERIDELVEIEALKLWKIKEKVIKKGIYIPINEYPITKEEANKFHRIYLDMIFEKIILYDKEDYFQKRIERLREKLKELGSYRVQFPNGKWYWVLKPDLKLGEEIEFGQL